MTTFGYLFILAGALAIRQVMVGRVKDFPSDIRDLAIALTSTDTTAMQEVLARRGENVSVEPSTSEVATEDGSTGTPIGPNASNNVLVKTTVALGTAAQGYRLGATGPSYYDCSGLIWQAARKTGVYKGARFTTSSFKSIASGWTTSVASPQIGDIILWEGDHMGILVGPDQMYSARSRAKGIGTSTVSGDSGYFGRQPTYWRVNA